MIGGTEPMTARVQRELEKKRNGKASPPQQHSNIPRWCPVHAQPTASGTLVLAPVREGFCFRKEQHRKEEHRHEHLLFLSPPPTPPILWEGQD